MYSIAEGGLLTYVFRNGGATETSVFWVTMAFLVATVVFSYLFGSINSAIIISKLLYHDDIRKHGSGNAGMTNMLRTYGTGAAGLTLVGDMLKSALAIIVAAVFFGFNYAPGAICLQDFCYVAGLCAVIGHIYPIYYGFKGGKGVLSTATVALILTPLPFLFLFVIFVIIVAISKYVSLGSVTVAMLYPVVFNGFCIVFYGRTDTGKTLTPALGVLCIIIIAITIVFKHLGNLQRISDRTERKISFKRKPTPEPIEEKTVSENDDEE